MQGNDADLALLLDAAQHAGTIARRHFKSGPRSWSKPNDQGPVTEADLEIDAMLHRRLLAARPEYGWLSEETRDTPQRLAHDSVFIVDPIDGTRAFMAGEHSFAHALAVIRQGQPVAAVVHLPMLDQTYTATADGGAFMNGQALRVSPRSQIDGARVLAAKPQLSSQLWPRGAPKVERHFRPSLAWRMALVAAGQFDAMLSLRPTWHWDIAAGALLVQEAGGLVGDADGRSLTFNTPRPQSTGIIAGGPDLHQALNDLRKPV